MRVSCSSFDSSPHCSSLCTRRSSRSPAGTGCVKRHVSTPEVTRCCKIWARPLERREGILLWRVPGCGLTSVEGLTPVLTTPPPWLLTFCFIWNWLMSRELFMKMSLKRSQIYFDDWLNTTMSFLLLFFFQTTHTEHHHIAHSHISDGLEFLRGINVSEKKKWEGNLSQMNWGDFDKAPQPRTDIVYKSGRDGGVLLAEHLLILTQLFGLVFPQVAGWMDGCNGGWVNLRACACVRAYVLKSCGFQHEDVNGKRLRGEMSIA